MATTTKTKVNSLAKDLGVKGKEIVDLLSSKGIADKTTSASLEDNEVSLVLNHFTKKYELSDIGEYFALKDAKKEAPAEPKEEKPAEKKEKFSAKMVWNCF